MTDDFLLRLHIGENDKFHFTSDPQDRNKFYLRYSSAYPLEPDICITLDQADVSQLYEEVHEEWIRKG